jgi:L-fuculose-phosphate aldolase
MNASFDIVAVHRQFKTIGASLMRINANNTHSGNMSRRDPFDSDLFYVTASGSQCGTLTPGDIVPVRLSDLSWRGDAPPSSEANTHRRVLGLPGVDACVHCHAFASTLISFESREDPVLLSPQGPNQSDARDFLFQPVDFFGAGLVGAIPVGFYRKPVGSSEMEERVTACLREAPVTIVAGHGPFARGRTLEQCLHYLSVLENSSILALLLRRRGMNPAAFQRAIAGGEFGQSFPYRPRTYDAGIPSLRPEADASLVSDFSCWLAYNFSSGLGAFGTGSMSRKVESDQMIFCPMSAAPEGVATPLYRCPLNLNDRAPEAGDIRLHRLIYTHTPFTACMVTSSPQATAEGMAVMAATCGGDAVTASFQGIDSGGGPPTEVAPIDAEGKYYQSRFGVVAASKVADESPDNPILKNLRGKGRCCIVAGYGMIAVGEKGLDQAAYIVSSAERSARFRQEVALNQKLFGGPPVGRFE